MGMVIPGPIRGAAAWLILSQVAMATSASAIVFVAACVLDRPIDSWWYVAAFLGTWAVHLRDSAASCDAEDAISQPRRAAFFRDSLGWSRILPVIAALGAVGTSLLARPSWPTLVLLGVVAILGVLHARPRHPRTSSDDPGGTRGIKKFAAWKSVVVSTSWGVAAVGLPVLESTAPMDPPARATALWLLSLLIPILLADSLLLDLRDRIADRTFSLSTLAVRLGPRGIHALVGVLLGFAAVLILPGSVEVIEPPVWRRVALASVLGLAIPWSAWRLVRTNEPTVAFSMMGWRFLAAFAVL